MNAQVSGEVGQFKDAFFTDGQETAGFSIDAANEFTNWGSEMQFRPMGGETSFSDDAHE